MRIARTTLVTVALVAAAIQAAPVSAQLNSFGFHLGVSRATNGGSFYDLIEEVGGKTESRNGFVLGAFVDYLLPVLDGKLSVQAGLDLAQKGSRIPEDGGLTERIVNLTYLDIPILARASFGDGLYKPYALAGPVLSLKLGEGGSVGGVVVENSDEVKGTDLGIAFGAGVERGAFGVELRYALGLTDVSTSTDPDEGVNNRQWALTASYRIPIPR